MSTHCYIGIENPDFSITFIFCHYDGYPAAIAPCLFEHYANAVKVGALMAKGNLDSLTPKLKIGDDGAKAQTLPRKDALHQMRNEHCYLFTKHGWQHRAPEPSFWPLQAALEEDVRARASRRAASQEQRVAPDAFQLEQRIAALEEFIGTGKGNT